MLEKLAAVVSRYEELCARSEQPDFYADPKKAAAILRQRNDLEPIVDCYGAYQAAQRDMDDAQELMAEPEMKELCQQTYQEARERREELTDSCSFCCCPRTPTMRKTSLWRSGAVSVVRKAPFLPIAYIGCTVCMPPVWAGAWN